MTSNLTAVHQLPLEPGTRVPLCPLCAPDTLGLGQDVPPPPARVEPASSAACKAWQGFAACSKGMCILPIRLQREPPLSRLKDETGGTVPQGLPAVALKPVWLPAGAVRAHAGELGDCTAALTAALLTALLVMKSP